MTGRIDSFIKVDRAAWKAWNNQRSGLVVGACVWLIFYLSPMLSGWAMASATDVKDGGSRTWLFSCVYVAVEAFTVLALWLGNVVYEGAQRSAEFDLRTSACGHAFRAHWRHRFGRGMAPGDLLVRVTKDPPELLLVMDCWIDFVGVLTYSLASMLVIGFISVRAMWIAIACWALFFFGSLWCSGKIAQAFVKERTAFDAVGERLVFIGRRFTQLLFGRTMDLQLRCYRDELKMRAAYSLNTSSLSALMTNANAAFGAICTGIVLCGVVGTGLDGAAIILLVAYLGKISQFPQKIGNLVATRRRATVALERIEGVGEIDCVEEVVSEHNDVVECAVALVGKIVRGDIPAGDGGKVQYVEYCEEFDNDVVYMIWDALLSAMERGMLPAGTVAFVRSSSGVYSGSIRDNLGGVDDEHGERVLLAVELDEMHSGARVRLDRLLAAEGVDLSGGERQRLIIGRAIASGAKAVIVDGGIAGIPVEQEARIYDNCISAGCVPVIVRARTI